jgi:hypothetical protein
MGLYLQVAQHVWSDVLATAAALPLHHTKVLFLVSRPHAGRNNEEPQAARDEISFRFYFRVSILC